MWKVSEVNTLYKISNSLFCKQGYNIVFRYYSSRFSRCFHQGHVRFSSASQQLTQQLKYRAVFIGSDNFSLPSLIALTDLLRPENVSVVVSNANNLIGKYAQNNSLELFHWNEFKSQDFEEEFRKRREIGIGFDFGVVASFGYLIPARVINRFPRGILNVHASLLPRWRGAAPIAYAIMNGDTVTGVSIMKIAPHKFDVGPVLLQSEAPLSPHIRAPELTKILAKIGAETISRVISNMHQYLSDPVIQEDSKVTLSPKLIPEIADVNWSSMSSTQVYNLFRGLCGFSKLRSSFLNRKIDLDEIGLVMVKGTGESTEKANDITSKDILDVNTDFEHFYPYPVTENVSSLPQDATPGQIVFHNDFLCVKCKDEREESQPGLLPWVFVRKLKIGTKWMSAIDFKNGFLSKNKNKTCYFVYSNSESANSNDNSISTKNNRIINR